MRPGDMNGPGRPADSGGAGPTSKWMSHPREATASQSQLSETREKGKPSVVSSFQILTG